MALSEDLVREELKKVIDPELFVNIVDLGLIYDVTITDAAPSASAQPADGESAAPQPDAPAADAAESEVAETDVSTASDNEPAGDHDVSIDMTLTSPMCPAGPQLIANSKQVVGALEEVANVEVKIVLDPPWSPDLMTEDARDQLGIF